MAEEQACLVRAHSDSENSSKLGSFGSISRTMAYTEDRLTVTEGAGEPGNNTMNMAVSPPENPGDGNENGELLDYNDSSVLEQFHEDALRQAGCGISQVRLAFASGLAVAGASLELSAIPFVLPSAEIELCILPHEKNWLVLISLVGSSLGAAGWGPLAERLGRRRALLSCLAVNAVFAAIAAVMPTYGTFMMARFCSAIGSGGIVSTAYTYLGESVPRGRRAAALALLPAAAGAGCLLAGAAAGAVLPPDGAAALLEDAQHFSAWHRYLLLCTLPILASLVSLIWTQESPRYLLEVGREVDAMGVYQSIHSSNQVRVCGKAHVAAAGAEAALALPGKRRPPHTHHVRHTLKLFWQSFFQLFSSTYRAKTLSLGGVLLFAMAIQFFLSSHIPALVLRQENKTFEAAKLTELNSTFENQEYNETMENVDFINVTFTNCTFRDLLLSHVQFKNCSFEDVAFENIKTSYANFLGCYFLNTTIIDTDMEVGRELDEWCVFNGSVFRGMRSGCGRHADLTSRLGGLVSEQSHVAHGMLAAACLALLPRAQQVLLFALACMLLTPSLYLLQSETALYIIEAIYRMFITLIFYCVSVKVVDIYPANLRCTAHGLILSVAYMGGAVVRGIGDTPAAVASLLCAALAASAVGCALRLRRE